MNNFAKRHEYWFTLLGLLLLGLVFGLAALVTK
jgi:hypothetical protein